MRLAILDALRDRAAGRGRSSICGPPPSETPKPGDPRLAGARAIDRRPAAGLARGGRRGRRAGRGLDAADPGRRVEGEAREVGKVHGGDRPARCARHGQPVAAPCVLLSGGETTVTVRGQGPRRAQRRVPAGARRRAERRARHLRARRRHRRHRRQRGQCRRHGRRRTRSPAPRRSGIDAKASLADNDAYGFFDALDDLVVTGPTLTNVNDFRAILVDESE